MRLLRAERPGGCSAGRPGSGGGPLRRWTSTAVKPALAIDRRLDHLAADRPRHPGDQAELALVLLAVLPGRPQRAEERVRVGARARRRRVSGGFCSAAASISTEAPGGDRPQVALLPLVSIRAGDSIRIASRSSSSLSLTTRRLAPSPSSRIAPASVSICSARNSDRLRGWTVKSDQRRDRRRLPDRGRHVLAADRPAVVQRQGQRGRVVRIRDRELAPPGRVERGEPRQMGPGIVAVNLQQVDLVGGRVVAHVVGGHRVARRSRSPGRPAGRRPRPTRGD